MNQLKKLIKHDLVICLNNDIIEGPEKAARGG
jgi:hypothetical protein